MAPFVRHVNAARVEVCTLGCLDVVPLPGGGVAFERDGESLLPTYGDLLAACEAQARFITATLCPEDAS